MPYPACCNSNWWSTLLFTKCLPQKAMISYKCEIPSIKILVKSVNSEYNC